MAAGSNAIGTGSLVLSANADKLVAGLDRAAKASMDFAKKQEKLAQKHQENIKKLVAPVAFGFVAGIGGTVVDHFKQLGTSIVEAISHVAMFRLEIERAAKISTEWMKVLDRGFRESDEWLGALADPVARFAEVQRQVAAAELELTGKTAALKGAREEVARLGRWVGEGATDSWKLWLGGGLGESLTAAKNNLTEIEAGVGKLKDRITDLKQIGNRLRNPSSDPALVGEINRLTEAWKLQADTFGMSATQAQLFALKVRGASDEMLSGAVAQAQRLQSLQNSDALSRLSGAFDPGSAGAYSIVAKFQTGNMLAANESQKQTRELQRINVALNLLRSLIASRGALDVI